MATYSTNMDYGRLAAPSMSGGTGRSRAGERTSFRSRSAAMSARGIMIFDSGQLGGSSRYQLE
jgi:hypothetical protein